MPRTASRPSTSSTALPTPETRTSPGTRDARCSRTEAERARARARRDRAGARAPVRLRGGDGAGVVFGAVVDSALGRAATESLAAGARAQARSPAARRSRRPADPRRELHRRRYRGITRGAEQPGRASRLRRVGRAAPPRSRQPSTTNTTRMTPAPHARPAPVRVIAVASQSSRPSCRLKVQVHASCHLPVIPSEARNLLLAPPGSVPAVKGNERPPSAAPPGSLYRAEERICTLLRAHLQGRPMIRFALCSSLHQCARRRGRFRPTDAVRRLHALRAPRARLGQVPHL